ncbi:SPOR domain-containing protein [Cohnella cholangitidis]|uniref:SPOR domain-containing protein n=1 Tax=Cohnella cholangitidis TaxID=2598458 RepID=A0A7G5C3M1_9BACL|nr:SPOR domain-containing protein [Cohnella cholangitidis]QMV43805.1 hypothetical protein FPL14_23510 [Cohnella cholangitidis]
MQQPKARMTIRFEPPVKPKGSAKPTLRTVELDAEKAEPVTEEVLTAWNSPYQDDIHALEEIIRRTEPAKESDYPTVQSLVPSVPIIDNPIARKPEYFRREITIDETSEDIWSRETPEFGQEDLRHAEWYSRTPNVREENPSWGRVFLSVAAAVGTGALFGYMVLSLFTGEPLFPGKSGTAAQLPVQASSSQTDTPGSAPPVSREPEQSDVPSAATPVAEENAGNSVNASNTELKTDVYYMLQYGVFQSEESMETAVKQLQEKGLAHASETSDGYRVYVGTARSRDEAELLAAQMPDTEIYIKPIGGDEQSVPATTLSEEDVEFMNASAGMIRKLAQISAIGLQDKLPQRLGEADLDSLENSRRAWVETIPAADKLNGKTAEDAEAIVKGIQSAMLSMTEFNRKPSRYHLWNVQSSVMAALLADRHMRSLFSSGDLG